MHPGEKIIIGNDFGTKHVDWSLRLTTTKGRLLEKAVCKNGCNIIHQESPLTGPPILIKY